MAGNENFLSMTDETVKQAMLASLRSYWQQAENYQKFLYSVGVFLLLTAVFHTGVLLATGGSWEGNISWRKPILFGESFGLTLFCIAWVMTFLPRRRVSGWLLAVTLGLASVYEVVWVSFQQWRGVPSHFNRNTSFDQELFDLAGVAIGFTGIVILVVTLLALFRLQAPPSLTWPIRAGLLLLVAGQVFGSLIIANDGNSFGAAGAMKIPHALSLHGLQVLPFLGWLLQFSRWSEERRTRIVVAGAGGYSLLVAVSAFQTFSGRAPLDLSLGAALLLAFGVLSMLVAFSRALVGLQSAPA